MLVVLAVMVVLYLRLWNRQEKSATHEVANGGENGHHYASPDNVVVNSHVSSNEKA